MTATANVRPRLSALYADRRGVAGIVVTVSLTLMVMLMLSGIDVVRAYMIKTRAQAAIDSAVLAAGHGLGTADCKTQGEAYFAANMGSNYLGSSLSKPLTFTVNQTVVTPKNAATVCALTHATGDIITATATVTLPLLSAGFITLGDVTFNVSNQAQRTTNSNLELVLAMDTTGSMAQDGKMKAMQDAAKSMVNSLFGNNSTGASIYIGLVPFNETVRAGKDSSGTVHKGWLIGSKPQHFSSTSNWNGCFFERKNSGSYMFDSTPPSTSPFEDWSSYYYRWTGSNWDTSSPYSTSSGSNSLGCDSNLAKVTFLSSDKQNLLDNITAMKADGSTMISSGVLWAWRMLDPAWRNSSADIGWGRPTLPQDAATTLTKAIVLLTDGNNAPYSSPSCEDWPFCFNKRYYAAGPYKGTPRKVNGNPTYQSNLLIDISNNITTSPLYVEAGKDPVETTAADQILLKACSNAKEAGITIFTIALNTRGDVSQNTQRLLTQCASNEGYYFNVSDVDDLNGVFSTISGRLSELKIVK